MKSFKNPLFPASAIRDNLARPLAFSAVLIFGCPATQAALTWDSTATTTNNWSTGVGNANWQPGPVVWLQNADALFDSTSGTPETIDVTTANTFNDITFDVSGFSLTSSGGGSLLLANDLASTITVTNAPDSAFIAENLVNNTGGASTLTKAGLGALILNGTSANTYSGGTVVSAGTLVSSQNTNVALLGSGPVAVAPSAALKLENISTAAPGSNVDTTIANAITGSGIVNTATPARALNLTGDWSGFTGTLNIGSSAAGKISVTPTVAMPSSASVTIIGGATFHSTSRTFTNNFSAAGTGNSENRGAFRLDNGCVISGNISLISNTTFGNNNANTTSTISGIISGAGLAPQTAATGGGIIAFSGLNDYTGKTIIAGQTIFSVSTINNSGDAGNLGKNGTIDFGATTNGGTLVYTGTGETTDRVINLTGATGGATITQSGTNLLKITGAVTAPGTMADDNRKTLTLNGSSAGTGELSGSIADSASGTAGQLAISITKSDSGTWTLSGNNSFTGGVTITEGNLVITNSNSLGIGPKTVTINAGTNKMLHLDNHGGADITLADALGFITNGNNAVIRNVAGSNTIAGAMTMSAGNGNTKIISDGGNILLSGAISANTGTRVLELSGTSTGEFSGALAAANTPAISKTGSGTWTLSGNNPSTGNTTTEAGTLVITGSVAGPAVVNGGTLKLDYAADASKLANGQPLVFGGGTLEIAGGTHTEIVASTTLTAGTVSHITQSSGTAKLQLNIVTPNSGALNFSADGIATTDNLNVNGILPWARFGSNWGTNSTNTPDGSIVAYTGGFENVTRLSGVVPNGVSNNIRIINGGNPGNVTLTAAPHFIGSLLMDASAGSSLIDPADSGNALSIGGEPGGTIWQTATSGALTIGTVAGDGILTTGNTANSTAAALTILNDSAIAAITVNSAISNNGTDVVSVGKGGVGHLTLAGDNTFTGTVTINAGSLAMTGNNNSTGNITANAGSLVMSGNNGFPGVLTVNATATATLSGNNSTRTAATTNLTIINSGGTLQLQANAGNITSGTSYALSAEQTASAQPLKLANGGLLQLRSDSTVNFAGGNNLGGLGSATVNIDVNNRSTGTGNTLTLAATGFPVNTTTINVTGGNGYTLGTGIITNVTGSNGAVLTLNPTSASMAIGGYSGITAFTSTLALGGTSAGNSVAGAITDTTSATPAAVSLSKSGSSTWTLNGANTFTGNITITAGTLAITGSGNLTGGAYAGNISNAGAFTYGSSSAQTLSGTISGAGTMAMTGSGTLTLPTANTYTGTTTITNGAVIAQSNAALGSNAAGTTISGNGTLDLGGSLAADALNLGTEIVTISGAGVGGNGTIVNNGTNSQTNALGRVVMAGNATIGGTKRWDIRSNTPSLNMGGSTLTKAGTNQVALVGATVGNPGNIVIDNGILSVETSTNLGGSAANTLTVNPGGTLLFHSNSVTIPWSVALNGGTMSQTSINTTVSGPVTLGTTGTNTISVAGTSLTLNGSVGGGGSLTKSGDGLLTVGNAISYSGDTTISAGTLKMNLASSFADASAIRLATGTILNLTIAGTDTVKELYIDNVKQPVGKWGRIGSITALGADHENAVITGDGLLQTSGSTYGDWINTFFPGVTNEAITGKTADPDNDGNNNLAEFGFDGNPMSGSDNPKIFVFTTDTVADGDSDKEVVMTAAIRAGAGAFTSAAPSTATSVADEITYSIQGGTTLGSFPTTVNAVPTAIVTGLPAVNSGYSYRSFSLGGSNGLPSMGFLRAGVE